MRLSGFRLTFAALLLAASALAPRASADLEAQGTEILGKRLPDWGALRFVDAPAQRRLRDFHGRVVVIRFWTDGCRFCAASAPVLTEWGRRYRDRGLVVLGIYHPKPPRAVSDSDVRRMARRIGLEGVLAVDEDWSALEKLWLRGRDRAFTSATLLVDREGVVRAIHSGGYLTDQGTAESRRQARAFEKTLRLLMESERI